MAAALRLGREALSSRERPADYNEAMEANFGLAAGLWSHKGQVCVNIWDEDEALTQVLEKTAR